MLELTILKNGAVLETRSLPPGEYGVGRDEGNAIVLRDPAVSGRHALLTVQDQGCRVRDLDSTNGTFCEGQRITTRDCSGPCELQLGAHLLRLAPAASETAKPSASGKGGLRALPPALVVYSVLATVVLIMGLFFYLPLQGAIRNYQQREALERGIILLRYLAEINSYPLARQDLDQVRVLPVSKEDGVVYAYVLDTYGKVLAPAQELGRFLELPGLDQALQRPELQIWVGPDGERVLYLPILQSRTRIGSALLGYNLGHAVAALESVGSGRAMVLFVIMLVLALGGGWYILRVFLRPLRQLSEEAGICLKERRDQLQFAGGYRELKGLVELFNRLLYLVNTRGAPTERKDASAKPFTASAAPEAAPPARDVPPSVEPQVAAPAPEVGADQALDPELPACTLHLQRFVLLSCNEGFRRLFPGPEGGGHWPAETHLLVLFQDPELLGAVSGLAENPAPQASVQVAGERNLTVEKHPLPGGTEQAGQDQAALFVFKS